MPETRLETPVQLRPRHPEPVHEAHPHRQSGRSKLPPSPAGGSTMATELEALEARALKLPVEERAAFAQRLLASLDPDTEERWAVEGERLVAESES